MGEERALFLFPAIRTWYFDTPRCCGATSRARSPSELAEVTVEEFKETLRAPGGLLRPRVDDSAHTLKQIRKALEVNEVFQAALSERASHVEKHPPLKVLLAEAAA